MTDVPVRERPYPGHQCACLLRPSNRCGEVIGHPDQPLCDNCVRDGHEYQPEFQFIRPQPGRFGP